ncbi:antirestriction protein ArdA [Citromicrobium bathyomarinum]|uniref:antirestriction protein ArdA n=1 Tax=Citromicrobium bathyomarinum TaxID=72174 RepID=UPI00315B1DC0
MIAVAECGYDASVDPDEVEIDIYELDSLTELADLFIEEGLFGDIPDRLRFYLDLDAIARDLSINYAEATIAGRRIIYRCG